MWVWEGYFDPKHKEHWLQAAEKMRHINPHVLQDVEDYILLKGYQKKNVKDKAKHIESHLHEKRMKVKNKTKEQEEEEKSHDKNRGYLHQMRPGPPGLNSCWNFFEDDKPTPHVLRHNANPFECYQDGRMESLFEDIEKLGYRLTRY